jgi:LuxR family transcriptional regulator, positive regulator of biofilm formation
MQKTHMMKQTSNEPADRYRMIYLVGLNNSLNGALSYVLEREVGSRCVILGSDDSIPEEEPSQDLGKVLFLVDCMQRDVEMEQAVLRVTGHSRNERTITALFNLQKGTDVEKRAFNKGIRGFFYRDDSLSQMLKGLRSLFQGEIWVSRDILVKVALSGRMKTASSVNKKSGLTRRETEILALLSAGSSNDDIADKLFISSNTVKTHLYRVFRKIKVPNRFQAALWAAKNL